MNALDHITRYLALKARSETSEGLDLSDMLALEALAALIGSRRFAAERAILSFGSSEIVLGNVTFSKDGVNVRDFPASAVLPGTEVRLRMNHGTKSYLFRVHVGWEGPHGVWLAFVASPVVLNWNPNRSVPRAVVELESKMAAA